MAHTVILAAFVCLIGLSVTSAQLPEHIIVDKSAFKTTAVPIKCIDKQECCKPAEIDSYFKVYTSMNTSTFQHTTLHVNGSNLEDFEMDIGVQGRWVFFVLSPTSPWHVTYYNIGFTDYKNGSIIFNERLSSNSGKLITEVLRNDVISQHHYTYYYIKISGANLEVGKRGEPPLINHTSKELSQLKFFSFAWWLDKNGKALYDCPAA